MAAVETRRIAFRIFQSESCHVDSVTSRRSPSFLFSITAAAGKGKVTPNPSTPIIANCGTCRVVVSASLYRHKIGGLPSSFASSSRAALPLWLLMDEIKADRRYGFETETQANWKGGWSFLENCYRSGKQPPRADLFNFAASLLRIAADFCVSTSDPILPKTLSYSS